jgi:hypothetical protein
MVKQGTCDDKVIETGFNVVAKNVDAANLQTRCVCR